MIFNVQKMLYFNGIRGIPCIFTKRCFVMGQEGGGGLRIPTRSIIRGIKNDIFS